MFSQRLQKNNHHKPIEVVLRTVRLSRCEHHFGAGPSAGIKWAGIWLLSRANSIKPLFRKMQTSLIAPPSGSMLVMLLPCKKD